MADGSRQAVFEPAAAGAPLRMRESDGRSKPRLWEAVSAFSPTPTDLGAFAGTYYSEEIDTTYTLYVEDGKLKARFRPAQRFELRPVYADAFETEGDVLRFTRDSSGRVAGFQVYAVRVRHLRFIRTGWFSLGFPLEAAMGIASKIPVRGGGAGGERSPRSDHQRRPGATRRGGAGKYLKKALF